MSTALSATDKERILQEEALRKEIRESLSPPEPKIVGFWPTVWKAANSNFGLWLLSAIFITFLGGWFEKELESNREAEQRREAELAEAAKRREAEDEQERRRKATFEQITIEISYRYSSTLAALRAQTKEPSNRAETVDHSALIAALAPMLSPASAERPPLYPEFRELSGLALIAELRRHASPGEADNLKSILAQTSFVLNEVLNRSPGSPPSPRHIAERLINAMKNPKWDNNFAYTDCSSTNPFC